MSRKPETLAVNKPLVTAMLLFATLLACGAADKDNAADEPKESGNSKTFAKSNADERPACMHCGATCGLAAVCVCEPGIKKQPRDDFDVECEAICVAGCSSMPWPFGRREARVGCTNCCEEPCRCPGWVRNCKKIRKETTVEEVPTIKRRVAYICACCAGGPLASCTGSNCDNRCEHRSAGWWAHLTWWWPRKPAD